MYGDLLYMRISCEREYNVLVAFGWKAEGLARYGIA